MILTIGFNSKKEQLTGNLWPSFVIHTIVLLACTALCAHIWVCKSFRPLHKYSNMTHQLDAWKWDRNLSIRYILIQMAMAGWIDFESKASYPSYFKENIGSTQRSKQIFKINSQSLEYDYCYDYYIVFRYWKGIMCKCVHTPHHTIPA
jgi:hypothetical protein